MLLALLVINLVLLVISVFLVLEYWGEKKLLRQFVSDMVYGREKSSPFDIALEIAGFIYSKVKKSEDPVFLSLPFLSPLGATPISVLLHGGCCSGLSRLLILSLDTLGTKAAQITLYGASGNAKHCLVEVSYDDKYLIVDPAYGFYYFNSTNLQISLRDLRAGAIPCFEKLPYSRSDSYPSNDYYNFNFQNTKTANWTKSWLRRGSYWFWERVTRCRIDYLKLPPYLEWPQLILLHLVIFLLGALVVVLLFLLNS